MKLFNISEEQQAKLDIWVIQQNQISILKQKANPPNVPRSILESCWEGGFPYGGAVGGNLTYSFTPTSLGVVATVTDVLTGNTIDLTDYLDW
jgi:hypothetical protein